MSIVKGHRAYERFKKGESLTHKQSIMAQCYVCNSLNEGGVDCEGKDCPLYQHMPYRADRKKKPLSEERRRQLTEQLAKARKLRQETKNPPSAH